MDSSDVSQQAAACATDPMALSPATAVQQAFAPTHNSAVQQDPAVITVDATVEHGGPLAMASATPLSAVASALAPAAVAQASAPRISGTLLPGCTTAASSEVAEFHVLACIACAEDVPGVAATRTPLRLIAVLDRSGSMCGEKIACLRRTMSYVVSQLQPVDELAIISFNHGSEVLLRMRKMDSAGQIAAQHAITGIEADGGTSISPALNKAFEVYDDHVATQLEADKNQPRAASIVLLTDGQDGGGGSANLDQYRPVLEGARRRALPLQCMGFGNDHDAKLLGHLSSRTTAGYSFIQRPQDVPEAFAACIGTLISCVSRDVRLVLGVPGATVSLDGGSVDDPAHVVDAPFTEPAARIVRLVTNYKSHVAPSDTTAQVDFGLLACGERRDMVVTLRLPALSAPSDAACVLRAWIVYTDLHTQQSHRVELEPCTIARVSAASLTPMAIHHDVQVALLREQATATLSSAAALVSDGGHAKALASLDATIATLRASPVASLPSMVSLLYELQACRETVETSSRTRSEAATAALTSCAMSNQQQRDFGTVLLCRDAAQVVSPYRNFAQAAMSAVLSAPAPAASPASLHTHTHT